MHINLWWWAIPKICAYLISRFYSNRENSMLAKYTFFTVVNKICHRNLQPLSKHQSVTVDRDGHGQQAMNYNKHRDVTTYLADLTTSSFTDSSSSDSCFSRRMSSIIFLHTTSSISSGGIISLTDIKYYSEFCTLLENTISSQQSNAATSSSFHATVACSSAVGPSLLRVRLPGTHCQTASEIQLCQPALSDVIRRLFFSPFTSVPAH